MFAIVFLTRRAILNKCGHFQNHSCVMVERTSRRTSNRLRKMVPSLTTLFGQKWQLKSDILLKIHQYFPNLPPKMIIVASNTHSTFFFDFSMMASSLSNILRKKTPTKKLDMIPRGLVSPLRYTEVRSSNATGPGRGATLF